ncbi:MAG: ABC transporter substrate-binding protein [Burkholderiales bacterium]|jgi:NitT/TauT family transport system substrate-binding protein
MHRVLASTAAAVALVCSTLAAPAAAQGKGESVKFQDYPGLGNMLVKVAIAKGYCEKAGIKCELQSIPAAPLGMQAMLAKSIDASFGPADVMNGAVLRGAKMKMVVGGAVTNVSALLVGNHVDAPNVGRGWPAFMQDMKGKKIGVTARGAATEVTGRWMAAKAGLDPDQLTFVAVGGPNTAYGALVSKQVDALLMFEPAGAMCEVLKTCKVAWRAAIDRQPAEQFALNGGGNGLIFTQEYIDRNPHVIDAVIRAVKEADAFINVPANFPEVSRIAQQFFKFDMPKGDEVLERALRIAIDSGTYKASIDRKAIQAGLDLLLETKQIDKAAPVSDLVLDRAP